jgi:hypothetical protein
LEAEIKIVLGDQKYDSLCIKMTNDALKNNDVNFVECKCGNIIELLEGKAY